MCKWNSTMCVNQTHSYSRTGQNHNWFIHDPTLNSQRALFFSTIFSVSECVWIDWIKGWPVAQKHRSLANWKVCLFTGSVTEHDTLVANGIFMLADDFVWLSATGDARELLFTLQKLGLVPICNFSGLILSSPSGSMRAWLICQF